MLKLDHDLDEVQTSVADTARKYFAATLTSGDVRALFGSSQGFHDWHWAAWAEMDWTRMLDAGLGARELVLLAREAGRALAPTPYLFASVAALAAPDGRAAAGLGQSRTDPVRRAADGTVTGTLKAVPYASGADGIVCRVGSDVVLVDPAGPNVEIVSWPGIDLTRRFHDVRLSAAPATVLACADWSRIETLTDLCLAADSSGAALAALDLALKHASTRKQFGQVIGAFQGVAHRCARMAFQIQGSWALVWEAATLIDERASADRISRKVSMAKAHASDTGISVTNSNLQIHGGLGYSAEHDCHLLLRRAVDNAHLWLSPHEHRSRVYHHLMTDDVD